MGRTLAVARDAAHARKPSWETLGAVCSAGDARTVTDHKSGRRTMDNAQLMPLLGGALIGIGLGHLLVSLAPGARRLRYTVSPARI